MSASTSESADKPTEDSPSHIEVDGVLLKLAQPFHGPGQWIGQQEILSQLLACWISLDDADLPLTPRLVGSPGVGKTQLAIAAAIAQQRPLYIYQCTADTRPEDLLVTPVLSQKGEIAYHASPLVTAVLRGGVCVLEGRQPNERKILGVTGTTF